MKPVLVISAVLIQCFAFAQQVNAGLNYSVRRPGTVNAKTPVLVMLHGYGSNENDLSDLGTVLLPQGLIFSLRAPNMLSNGGFSWFKFRDLPDMRRSYDLKQLRESRQKIVSFITAACRTFGADSARVFVLGFSQGAIMCFDLALNAPSRIYAIAALSGRMLERPKKVTDSLSLKQLRIFIAHGNSDNVILPAESDTASYYFKDHKVDALLYRRYDMPHSISGAELNDLKAWFRKHSAGG